VVFLSQLNRIAGSNDCHFGETFCNAMCRTWRPLSDELSLRPTKSLPPKPNIFHEYTGDATTLPSPSTLPTHTEEGNDNITLNRGANHHKKQQMQIIQKMNPCTIPWIYRTPSQKMKKMNMIPLEALNPWRIIIMH
jgi:hypothetical protein